MLQSLANDKYLPFLLWYVAPFAIVHFLVALIRTVRVAALWSFLILYVGGCAVLWTCDWFAYCINVQAYGTPNPSLVWPAIIVLGSLALVGGFFLARSLRPK